MEQSKIAEVRKKSQQYVYASLQLHESISRKMGFSGTDHKYLGILLQKGSVTAGELADITGLTTGAITGLIDRFEKSKLVKRQPDKNDRRKVLVVPNSKKIVALLEPFYKEFQNETDALLTSLSDSEMEIIEAYLVKSILLIEKTSNKLNQ